MGGQTVVMVHGWGARATRTGKMIEPLVLAGYRVPCLDAPAHGASSGKRTAPVEIAAAVHGVARYAHHTRVAMSHSHSFGAARTLQADRDLDDMGDRFVPVSPIKNGMWFTETFRRYAGVSVDTMCHARQIVGDLYCGRFISESTEMLRSARRSSFTTITTPKFHSRTARRSWMWALQVKRFATNGLGRHRLVGHAKVIERGVDFVKARSHRCAASARVFLRAFRTVSARRRILHNFSTLDGLLLAVHWVFGCAVAGLCSCISCLLVCARAENILQSEQYRNYSY